ncbi:MAG: aldo/keto reductase [Synergistaceae bacterium]|nr:aldo/keto reductase [Synergistaceae bacterium]
MLYRKMPRVGEEFSVLGFGCMRLPVRNGQVDEAAASRMMRTAIDKGINYVDTAWPYHGGQGEAIVGRLLEGGLRDKVTLATKLPSWLVRTRGDMDTFLEKQLVSLQTDHIDVYLLHSLTADRWENLMRLDALGFMEKARAAGKIRYIAFSFHDGLDCFKKIVDAYPWDLCQIQYNLLDENYQAGREGLRYASGKGIGVVVMEPLKGGNITIPMPGELGAAAKKAGYSRSTLADIALRWVWNHPEVGLLLSGMSSEEQMDQNIESAARGRPNSLTPEELAFVKAARDLYEGKMRVPCTACAYCKPCPKSVDIPQCFSNLNNAAISGNWEAQKANYLYILADDRDGNRASACVECGLCETRCPQHIPIREKLKEVAAAFETSAA